MSALTDILLAPDVRPFAVAAAIMLALGGIELLAMLVGFSISELIGKEVAVDVDSGNGLGGLFLWINAGRLPLLILIILALGVFSIAGFFLQGLAGGVGIWTPPAPGRQGSGCAFSSPAVGVGVQGLVRASPRWPGWRTATGYLRRLWVWLGFHRSPTATALDLGVEVPSGAASCRCC